VKLGGWFTLGHSPKNGFAESIIRDQRRKLPFALMAIIIPKGNVCVCVCGGGGVGRIKVA